MIGTIMQIKWCQNVNTEENLVIILLNYLKKIP